jgi:hypothetical protein
VSDSSEVVEPTGKGDLQPEVVALMLRAVASQAMKNLDLVKAELGSYEDGQRSTFRSPLDGAKLGQVWRTDPDPEWVIVDRPALLQHLSGYPGNFETVLKIVGDEAEVLAVLQEHAPHLIEEDSFIPEWVFQAALEASKEANEAVAPGIKKIKPGGVLTVAPDKKAGEAFSALVKAGLLSWDGKRAIGGSS